MLFLAGKPAVKKQPVIVVAAIIRENKRILICKRKNREWEFPGGKLEYGETPEQALVREIREELCCEIEVRGIFGVSSVIARNGGNFVLLFYLCGINSGRPKANEHERMEWVLPSELKNFEFAEADLETVEKLAQQSD